MLIGVPSEIKAQESRVGLTPESVQKLIKHGHQVIVQDQAGYGAGFENSDYENSGAKILKEASAVAVPNSVFWSAAGALGKNVNLAYFARGEEDLNRRKHEIHYNQKTPFYNEDFYKSVVYEVEMLT